MERRLIKSADYLQRIYNQDEAISEAEIEASVERLKEPIVEISYEKAGEAVIDLKIAKLQMAYAPVDAEAAEVLQAYADEKSRIYPENEGLTDLNNWRQIKKLRIEPQASDQAVDLLAVMPSDYQVFFCAQEPFLNGAVMIEQRKIFLLGGLGSIRGLVTLLHEIGHAWDGENLKKYGVDRFTDQGFHWEKAERLRQERAASAFALKILRPYIKGDLRKDVINHLKHFALESYEQHIRRQLAQHASMAHFAGGYEDDYSYDDQQWEQDEFEKFKATDAYKEWKALDQFKELEDYEEFNNWLEWMEPQWEAEREQFRLEKIQQQLSAIQKIDEIFLDLKKDYWLAGGFAMEILAGHQKKEFRDHQTLVFIMESADSQTIKNQLAAQGYQIIEAAETYDGQKIHWDDRFIAEKETERLQFVYIKKAGEDFSFLKEPSLNFSAQLLPKEKQAVFNDGSFSMASLELILAMKLHSLRENDRADLEKLKQSVPDFQRLSNKYYTVSMQKLANIANED